MRFRLIGIQKCNSCASRTNKGKQQPAEKKKLSFATFAKSIKYKVLFFLSLSFIITIIIMIIFNYWSLCVCAAYMAGKIFHIYNNSSLLVFRSRSLSFDYC